MYLARLSRPLVHYLAFALLFSTDTNIYYIVYGNGMSEKLVSLTGTIPVRIKGIYQLYFILSLSLIFMNTKEISTIFQL